MSLGSRLAALFIAPARGPRTEQAPTPRAETIVVLCRAAHAVRAARAVAAAARGRSGSDTALVCAWGAGAGPRGAWIELTGGSEDCMQGLRRACTTVSPGPLVLLLCGERPEELDRLVAGADAVVVVADAGEDEEVASIVLSRSAAPAQRGGVLVLPAGTGARMAERVTDALADSVRRLLDRDPEVRTAHSGGQAHALA